MHSVAFFQAKSQELKLYEHPTWKKLLYYQTSFGLYPHSLIDSQEFFLSADGNTNPSNEMLADIAGFFAPLKSGEDSNLHTQCRLPARLKWLQSELGIRQSDLPSIDCTSLRQFNQLNQFQAVSLVFSSYYLNSPGSMFGHTLLRLHRQNGLEDASDGHLDLALNFAAEMSPDVGAFDYVWKGLTGQFEGRFKLMPYYLKLQEYMYHERRDLWEYQLDFTPEEIQAMMLSVWEFGENHANYFYLTENCSYVLLYVLENARPSLNLLRQLNYSVIPVDTLHVAIKSPGLIKDIRFRPSSHSRYKERQQAISVQNRPLLASLLKLGNDEDLRQILHRLDQEEQRKVLDAGLEFIDFDEKLALSQESQKYSFLRPKLLRLRASLGGSSASLSHIPLERRPDLSHATNMLSLGLAAQPSGPSQILVRWRPAMHDLLSPPTGFSPYSTMSVLDTKLRVDQAGKHAQIESVDVVAIQNFQPLTLENQSPSFRLRTGLEPLAPLNNEADVLAYGGAFGMGLTLSALDDQVLLYALPGFGARIELERSHRFESYGNIEAGQLLRINQNYRLLATEEWGKTFNGTIREFGTNTLMISYLAQSQMEIRTGIQWRKNRPEELSINLLHFY
ncbi:MAG: DUF4105 domain-containing protein [Proteobacteria bacterium]|nr:DUF4105 domain-containing protein [Pseudomonadota bacterium]